MAFQERPFSYLFHHFSCVVVLRDKALEQTVARALHNLPLVQVIACNSAAQAEAVILQRDNVHCCICGPGLDDRRGDELYLLKRFGDNIPFVMYLPGEFVELSAECMRFTAASVLMASTHGRESAELVVRVCTHIIRGIVCVRRSYENEMSLRRVLATLFCKRPESVTEWAIDHGMSRRHLVRICDAYCVSAPRYVLICAQILQAAFGYYLNEFLGCKKNYAGQSLVNIEDRISRKYCDHRELMEEIMFGKRKYRCLPVRSYEDIILYDAPAVSKPSPPSKKPRTLAKRRAHRKK